MSNKKAAAHSWEKNMQRLIPAESGPTFGNECVETLEAHQFDKDLHFALGKPRPSRSQSKLLHTVAVWGEAPFSAEAEFLEKNFEGW